ncbi:CHAT domain-containing protein [Morchella snyderi]|nr:CHAT domain-containing protein [Morchella snyderi]
MDDLEAAIVNAQAALSIVSDTGVPHTYPDLPTIQSNLSCYLGRRYEHLGDPADLDLALEHGKEAVKITNAGDHSLAGRMANLSNRYDARYQRLDDMDDLDRAIEYAEAAVGASKVQGGDYAYTPIALDNLSSCLYSRYKRTLDSNYLEAAIMNINEGIGLVQARMQLEGQDNNDPQYIRLLNNLSTYLEDRFKLLGQVDDIEVAITHSESVLSATPDGHPNRAGRLNGLSTRYHIRYLALAKVADLEKSLTLAKALVETTPAGHPQLGPRLSVLSSRYRARFDRIGDIEDLNLAISCAHNAEAATPIGHPQRVLRLMNLSQVFYFRYERFGKMDDLEAAIHQAEMALAGIPDDHIGRRIPCLKVLSVCLDSRYHRLGALKDLEAAIMYAEEVIKATPETSASLGDCLNNLSTHYDARYQRLGQPADLDLAISTAKAALAATTDESRTRGTILSNLSAIMLFGYFTRNTSEHDEPTKILLDEAIAYAEEAVKLTSEDDPYLPGRLSNLSALLERRFEQNGQVVDLEAAIDQGENALVHAPLDHPGLAGLLISLAYTFVLRYNLSNSPSDGKRAHAMYLGAWNCVDSPPLQRINAARYAVQFFPSLSSWDDASSMLEDAVRLMPKLSLATSLERDDQQQVLGELYGLSSLAAAAALEAGKGAAHALGLLELGRGILSGHVINTRSDLVDLKRTHPKLWKEFVSLQMEINAPLDKASNPGVSLARRKDAMEELDRSLADIRAIPQYGGFLLPSTAESMCMTAEGGTIVVVNCTEIRSDAIIVTPSGISALALPKLDYKEMRANMALFPDLLKGTLRTVATRNKELGRILRWLWEAAVEAILGRLELRASRTAEADQESGHLPRIWWIGTGDLSKAPFHAAGIHTPKSTKHTLNRVCSSYIPTIKSLSYAREQTFPPTPLTTAPPQTRAALLVSMPETPGHPPLPYVAQEATMVSNIIEQVMPPRPLIRPTALEVLQQLPDHDVVHFACHGVSDRAHPSNSSLLLVDSSSADPLTVQAVSDAHIRRAQLAYLSACSTADNTAAHLGDETVHLASAFQLAGFAHVVANLWQSKDDACMQVAGDFYRTLFGRGAVEGAEQHARVSIALHGAVARLRKTNLKAPLVWAPFIHTGA